MAWLVAHQNQCNIVELCIMSTGGTFTRSVPTDTLRAVMYSDKIIQGSTNQTAHNISSNSQIPLDDAHKVNF